MTEEGGQSADTTDTQDPIEYISQLAGVRIRPRAPTRIGGRMGRPEKASERKMSPAVHALFPIGESGGAQRLLSKAQGFGTITATVGKRICKGCGEEYFLAKCPLCGGNTRPVKTKKDGSLVEPEPAPLPPVDYDDSSAVERDPDDEDVTGLEEGGGSTISYDDTKVEEVTVRIDVFGLVQKAKKHLDIQRVPKMKAVKGLSSSGKIPEPLEKGILRARNDVYVFKDGTARFDMTDLPLTHFRPREIGLGVDKARELGYHRDIHGEELVSGEQILELKAQDVVPSKTCLEYFVKVAKFVDELLERFYGLEPYYQAEDIQDLYGRLCIGLAPHTSGGVLCRLIGYSTAKVCYAHPFFHAAKRRNCDGDEDALMLLMDGLLNFSKSFLPSKRGGLMDAPLVLSSRLNPSEIDGEAHNIDTLFEYPLEFYEATLNYASPKDWEKTMDIVKGRLGTELQYEGFGFTHDTADINEGPKSTAYGIFKTMELKMQAQLRLGKKLVCVDEDDVAARVIATHLLPDIIGNLNAFSKQKVRCTKCNTKYRRIPLAGKCSKITTVMEQNGNLAKRPCGGKLTMTVHEGSVKKYVNISLKVAQQYQLSEYLQQRIQLLNEYIKSIFENDKIKKTTLDQFL